MRRLALAALLLLGGCYDVDSFPGLYHGDGGVSDDASSDGGAAGPRLELLAGALGGGGFADGSGGAARFYSPSGTCVVGTTLFVADFGNNVIRKVDLTTMQVTLFAGSPVLAGFRDGPGATALFRNPYDLVADAAGNLYVTDLGNSVIRKIDPSGNVSLFAGQVLQYGAKDGAQFSATFGNPRGIETDGTNLYVGDGSNAVRKVVLATGAVSTIAGQPFVQGAADGIGTQATFRYPGDLAFDGMNHLVVTDQNNRTVRLIDLSTLQVSTLAGLAGASNHVDGTGSAARFFGPTGAISDGKGHAFISDGSSVRQVTIATGEVITVAGDISFGAADGVRSQASFRSALGLALSTNTLYVADVDNNTVRAVDLTTGQVTTPFGDHGQFGTQDGVAGRFFRPQGIAADATGLYVADSGNGLVRAVAADGSVSTIAGGGQPGTDGNGAMAGFAEPRGIASDGNGTLYVADRLGCTIRKVVVAGGAVTTIAGTFGQCGSTDDVGPAARFSYPRALALDDAGALYVTDTDNQTVRRVDLASHAVTTLAGTAGQGGATDGTGATARFNQPSAITFTGGVLYVADLGSSLLRRVDRNGAVTTVAGVAGQPGTADGGPGAGLLDQPAGLTADGAGGLFIADFASSTLRHLTGGALSTTAGVPGRAEVTLGPLPAQLNHPAGLALRPDGALVISTPLENALLVVR